jgi:2-polyprenyl-3-methyl-5-hydroxy-6-metoxy-1,4-benzoquinol methylase
MMNEPNKPSFTALFQRLSSLPEDAQPPKLLMDSVKAADDADVENQESLKVEVVQWIGNLLKQQMTRATGDAVYTENTLNVYDVVVWDFNSPFLWRITADVVQTLYQDCLAGSISHAEVAVGTGLFLERCLHSSSVQHVTLIDLNENSLQACQDIIERSRPDGGPSMDVKTKMCDILQPLSDDQKYDSVAVNFLLHCLKGDTIWDKRAALENCGKILSDNGVMFGSTILGKELQDDTENAGEAALLTLLSYNKAGIFGNLGDTFDDLSNLLKGLFESVDIRRVGYCAVWKAKGFKGEK